MRTVAGAHQNCHWSPEWLLQGSLPGPNRLECGKGDPTPGPMVGLGRDANCYWEASRMCREATGMQWGQAGGGLGGARSDGKDARAQACPYHVCRAQNPGFEELYMLTYELCCLRQVTDGL